MDNSSIVQKAIVAEVPVGKLKISGLMLPDGAYAVAVPQIYDLFGGDVGFGTDKEYATTYLKRLMGKGFRPDKTATELGNQKIAYVLLPDFEKTVAKLDRAGNKKAQNFRDDMVSLSLTQLFADAFGVKFEQKERQEYLIERMVHREHFHPTVTAWWKADGLESGVEYAERVNRFKACAKLPVKPIKEYSGYELSKLNNAEAAYHTARKLGHNHEVAISVLG
jgi:hypothetical protein